MRAVRAVRAVRAWDELFDNAALESRRGEAGVDLKHSLLVGGS